MTSEFSHIKQIQQLEGAHNNKYFNGLNYDYCNSNSLQDVSLNQNYFLYDKGNPQPLPTPLLINRSQTTTREVAHTRHARCSTQKANSLLLLARGFELETSNFWDLAKDILLCLLHKFAISGYIKLGFPK